MIDVTTKTTDTSLWWSDGGAMRCRAHLPLPGSASWWADGWVRMPPEQRERLGRVSGKPIACELCEQRAAGAHAEYLAARTAIVPVPPALPNAADVDDNETTHGGAVTSSSDVHECVAHTSSAAAATSGPVCRPRRFRRPM